MATWIAWVPLPLAVLAAVSAALHWPDGERAALAAIVTLNFALLYAVVLVVGRVVGGSVSGRVVGIALVVSLVYHLVALALPRPQSGIVRLGAGDLMLLGGAAIHGGLGDLTTPLRRGSLREVAKLQGVLTGTTPGAFFVERAACWDGGWILEGHLADGGGVEVTHVVGLSEPLAVQSTVVEDDVNPLSVDLSDGQWRALTEELVVTISPGVAPSRVVLPAETTRWLQSALEVRAKWANGGWHVLAATGGSTEVGLVAPDGALSNVVRVDGAANLHDVALVGGRVFAVVQNFGEGGEAFRGVVSVAGALDEGASARLTEVLVGRGLAGPVRLYAGDSVLWIVGYDGARSATVALKFPDGEPIVLQPGTFLDGVTDGDDLIVATGRTLLRVDGSAARSLAQVWIPAAMLSVSGGTAAGAVRERKKDALTLTEVAADGPRVFLPELRLSAR